MIFLMVLIWYSIVQTKVKRRQTHFQSWIILRNSLLHLFEVLANTELKNGKFSEVTWNPFFNPPFMDSA